MSVYRVEKSHDYTVMANHHLRSKTLTLKAKGLLSLILSLPDDWNITIEGLAALSGDGKSAVRSAIEELKAEGYVTREQVHSETGQFGGYQYTIHEVPCIAEEEAEAEASPSSENRTMAPSSEKPTTEKPSTENRTQLSTIELSTNIPPIVPQKGTRRAAKKVPDWESERFERFWAAYPLGKAKQKAVAAWDKLRPDEATMTAMAVGLKKQLASELWQRGIGIPYASTWINQRRWEDEERGAIPHVPDEEPEVEEW